MKQTTPVIAVVDDEQSVCRALGRLLRSAGFSIKAYTAGDEFLDGLSDWRIDCVILDLHMPPPDGFAVLERLFAQDPCPPVIILTGHDSPASRQRVAAIGPVNKFLRKPIDADQLLGAVHQALSMPLPPQPQTNLPDA